MSEKMEVQRKDLQQNQEKFDFFLKKSELDVSRASESTSNRLMTCNHCQIYIEQYEYNYHKTISSMVKQATNWDKLNGNQKLAKFSKLIEQNLKILKNEFQHKCQYAKKEQLYSHIKISDLTCLF